LDGVFGEVNRQLLAIVLVVCFQTQVKFMAWQAGRQALQRGIMRKSKATRE
jgi:hypothetical protein